jgi:hypothetical protein
MLVQSSPVLKRVLIVLGVVVALPYARGPLYDFPEPRPFEGARFFNPYDNLQRHWQRANFHAHGHAWGGLTSGRQSSEAVARKYRAIGYSVPGVSNYHRIAAHEGVATLPIYEHGYNIGKHHQLAIGAHRVAWFDFPLWQSLSHRQFIIDHVAESTELVALAHPPTRNAYSEEDLARLTGYHLLEIVNGPHRSEVPWDAALSSGRAVWALANDDSHDLNDPRRTAMAWNMINAASASTHDIIEALRAGRAYAVMRTNEMASAIETVVSDISFAGDTLVVRCSGEPSTFTFVGQDGEIRKTVSDATTAEYTFAADDTYVRTVIRSPRTAIYLNPVLRYDGAHIPTPAAAVDTVSTWLLRLSFAGGFVLLLFAYRRRRGLALNTAAQPALTEADRRTA